MFVTYRALALFAVPAVIAAAPQPVPSGDMAKVQAHLAAITTMTAGFTQTDRNGQVLTGTLSLKRPGKVRFQYQKGVPILIVGDGNALTFIDYSVKQVQRWPIGKSPLGVLLDPKRDIGGIAKLVPSGDPSIISVEANDPKHPDFGKITLIFQRDEASPAGLRMLGWVALDPQNNRTTIRLSNIKFNAPIADGTFRWSDPRTSTRGK
jgi:outer membrane lipoprotein-sorting protein